MAQLDTKFQSWRKSTRSQPNGNDCVEVGFSANAVGVRDTKNRAAGTLAFSGKAWAAFLAKR